MNNDPPPSPSASPPPSRADDTDAAGPVPDAGRRQDDNGAALSSSTSESSQKRKAGLAKKLQFMSHLMQSLDKLVFAEICTLYYMELLLRTVPHYFFLTPKSEDVLLLLPAHRAHVFAIFIPTLLCMLLHLVFSPPHASEATRGYLHGGVIVDFIGQTPPSSRFTLLLLDVVIMALQSLMLAVHQEREKLRTHLLPSRRSRANAEVPILPTITTQDHDAEERGVLRDGTAVTDGADDIELRPLSGGHGPTTEAEGGESTGLLASSSSRRASVAPDSMGVLRSGNAILGDFYVIDAVRTASSDYQGTTTESLSTIGYTATLAAMAAERRARFQARRR